MENKWEHLLSLIPYWPENKQIDLGQERQADICIIGHFSDDQGGTAGKKGNDSLFSKWNWYN